MMSLNHESQDIFDRIGDENESRLNREIDSILTDNDKWTGSAQPRNHIVWGRLLFGIIVGFIVGSIVGVVLFYL